MDSLTKLNDTLNLARSILDNAASQIRDAALSPTRENIMSIGHALVHIFDIQNAIYKLRPELEKQYEEVPEETKVANRRLGEALIAAYDLADAGHVSDAVSYLERFAEHESSEFHRSLAKSEQKRIVDNYGV